MGLPDSVGVALQAMGAELQKPENADLAMALEEACAVYEKAQSAILMELIPRMGLDLEQFRHWAEERGKP